MEIKYGKKEKGNHHLCRFPGLVNKMKNLEEIKKENKEANVIKNGRILLYDGTIVTQGNSTTSVIVILEDGQTTFITATCLEYLVKYQNTLNSSLLQLLMKEIERLKKERETHEKI